MGIRTTTVTCLRKAPEANVGGRVETGTKQRRVHRHLEILGAALILVLVIRHIPVFLGQQLQPVIAFTLVLTLEVVQQSIRQELGVSQKESGTKPQIEFVIIYERERERESERNSNKTI